MKSGVKQAILDGSGTVIGAMIMAFGISLFLLPNQLSTGGFSGIATITYYLFNIPMGLMNLILNIPMFIFSNYRIGKKFLIKSIVGTASLSVFIDIFDKIEPITTDRFLASIISIWGNNNWNRNSNNFKSRSIYWWNRINCKFNKII